MFRAGFKEYNTGRFAASEPAFYLSGRDPDPAGRDDIGTKIFFDLNAINTPQHKGYAKWNAI